MGNVTCLTYDTLHRVTSQTYPTGPYASTTKRFYVYDSATVNGATMSNAKTRLAEAYTCTSCPATKITDLGFSYSARGELVDEYQSTPNSGGFYHTTAAYYPNGALNSLSGVPGQSAWTFGVDAEGRPTSAAQGATNLVTSVAFNTASQPKTISFAQGDSDSYEYDANTGRMTKYTFTVGSTPQAMVGNLTWNANGTLSKQVITDGFNASGAQTCKYGDPTASVAGYDDLGRLIKVDCGLSMWQQNFSYDAFGNITKNVPTGAAGINWIPGYSSATNRYTLGGTTYDLDGNLTNDSFHTHWWNTEGKIASIGSATCGGSGVICLTYDALGRVVERQNGAAFTEFLYSPIGKTATMTGQTLSNAAIPLPGGTRLYYATATNKQLWHKDWLGSVRLTSSFSSRTIVADRAVAPYGEPYNVVTGGGANMFAQNEQAIFTVSAASSQPYDTPNREMHPTQGRWLSPDPLGLGAVGLGSPQSWNRYAYVVGNPLVYVDPDGTSCDYDECVSVSAGFLPGPEIQNVYASNVIPNSIPYGAQSGNNGAGTNTNTIGPFKPVKPCHVEDPVLGALETKVKVGPEVQAGWLKVGMSMYKHIYSGETGGVIEADTGLIGIQGDNPTPEGGSFNGGGPDNIQWKVSILGFQHDLGFGGWSFEPSKSFSVGAQLLVGFEVTFNANTYLQISKANEQCIAQGGH